MQIRKEIFKQYVLVALALLSMVPKLLAQTAEAVQKVKPIIHAVESSNIGLGRELKLFVVSSGTGSSNTFNRIYGYLLDPAAAVSTGKTKRAVDLLRYEPDVDMITLFYRNENGNSINLTPSPKIREFLDGKGSVPMASDSNITIVKPAPLTPPLPPMRDHTQLRAFELADQVALMIYKVTSSFPQNEAYGLTSQMRRAAVSIPSNIVEGCARATQQEYGRFLDIAFGSLRELMYQFSLASRLGYIPPASAPDIEASLSESERVLSALIRSLRRTSQSVPLNPSQP